MKAENYTYKSFYVLTAKGLKNAVQKQLSDNPHSQFKK